MLCLLKTKRSQVDDIIAPSLYPAITLTSRIYDHEKGLVRHILSYVGTNQGAPLSQHELDVIHAIERTSGPLQHVISSQQQTNEALQLTIAELQQVISSQQQTIAQLSAALTSFSSSDVPSSKRARGE